MGCGGQIITKTGIVKKAMLRNNITKTAIVKRADVELVFFINN